MEMIFALMKFMATSVFILLVLLQTFSKEIILLLYFCYKEYITENYCIKKDTDLRCEGKCHLNKMLSSNDTNTPLDEQWKVNIPDFLFTGVVALKEEILKPILLTTYHKYIPASLSCFTKDIFHPPSVCPILFS